jgi:hypothetical protein
MDPYLEAPTTFPGLHNRLIALLGEALQVALPAPYFAEIGERAWAVVPHDERREPYLEIRTTGDEGERLVTAIEVLSPSDKTPGERGRELYLRKQREVLESRTHLVEIDLLRGGRHTTAVPLDRLREAVGPCDYHVAIHRSDRFEDFLLDPIRLPDPLPEIAVPLLPGDPDVAVDLQELFNRAYDVGPYRRRIRYRETSPVPPLPEEYRDWARGLPLPD